jgi:hypothetical protein
MFLWDLHSTHADADVVNLQEEENAGSAFMPGKATDRLQLQDQEEFHQLSAESRKDIAKWVAFLGAKGISLAMEDFPMVVQRALKASQTNSILTKGLQNIGLVQLTPSGDMEISPDPDKVLRNMEGAGSFASYEIQFREEEKRLEEDKRLEAEKGKDEEFKGEELLGVLDSDGDVPSEGGSQREQRLRERNDRRQKQEREDNDMWFLIASDNRDNRDTATQAPATGYAKAGLGRSQEA